VRARPHSSQVTEALLVSTSFPPGTGGIETYLEGLCRRLGARIAVLAPATRDGRPIPEGVASPVLGYPGRMAVPVPRVVRAIVEAAARERTNRVLFGSAWPLALCGPSLLEHGLHYGVIVHGAEMLVPSAAPGLRRLLVRSLEHADLLLPVSEFTAGRIRSLLHVPFPGAVLRAQVDLERYSPAADAAGMRRRLDLDPHHKVVLFLGRLVRRKGVHRLLDVLPEVVAQVPDVVFVVAGAGPQQQALRRRARRQRHVVFAGRVPEADTPGLHACASVFTLPVVDRWWGLDTEGLGIALLEAQASAVPCVTGRSGGTPEAVVNGSTGLVVDARDPAALTNALVLLLDNPDKAAAMGAAGRDHVARTFGGDLPSPLLDWLR
jgi:phosphatidylinositol alpha-1,6-mannosyltransferase